MKKILTAILMMTVLILMSCTGRTTETETTAMPIECDLTFTETTDETIPIRSLSSDTSTIEGDIDRFLNLCHGPGDGDLVFTDAIIKTHQFIIGFDKVYPLGSLAFLSGDVDELSIDVSMNGERFTRIHEDIDPDQTNISFDNRMVKYVRFTFPKQETGVRIRDVAIRLGSGLIVDDESAWRDVLFRYDGWTGADGIFSFELDGDPMFSETKDNIGFIFSDTIIGDVSERNHLRNQRDIINNSFGYYDESADIRDGFSFIYGGSRGEPESLFPPDGYLGYHPGNLLSVEGLSAYHDEDALLSDLGPGVMWRAPMEEDLALTIDLKSLHDVDTITVWNANADPGIGVKTMSIYAGETPDPWMHLDTVNLPKASGSEQEPATLTIDVPDTRARYVKLIIDEGHDDAMAGLGKLLIRNDEGDALFGEITAPYDPMVTGNETTARLWFQDGIVVDGHLYMFPLVVKDHETIFRVTEVGMVDVPVVDGKIQPENASYRRSPLQSITPDGDVIYYGGAIMDNTDVDGHVYVYGYLDDDAGRHLTVSRTTREHIDDFNAYEYYDGTGWSSSINDSARLIEGVSAEFSVTRLPGGRHAGEYALFAMEDTTSGRIVRALADAPTGPFDDFERLYQTNEGNELRGAFTYNAKLHPALSTPDRLVVSYNVNTHIVSALIDADIYYPRFLIITETHDND